jgi:hypothetical protein
MKDSLVWLILLPEGELTLIVSKQEDISKISLPKAPFVVDGISTPDFPPLTSHLTTTKSKPCLILRETLHQGGEAVDLLGPLSITLRSVPDELMHHAPLMEGVGKRRRDLTTELLGAVLTNATHGRVIIA